MKIKLFVKYISLLVLLFVADGCKEKKADTYVTKVTDLTGEEEQVLKLEYDRDGKIIKYGDTPVRYEGDQITIGQMDCLNTGNKLCNVTFQIGKGKARESRARCMLKVGEEVYEADKQTVYDYKGDTIFNPVRLKFQSREGIVWNTLTTLEDYLFDSLPANIIQAMLDYGWALDGEIYLPGYSVNEINHFVKDPNDAHNKLLQFWCYDIAIPEMVQHKRDRIRFDIKPRIVFDDKDKHLNNKEQLIILPTYDICNDNDAHAWRDKFIDLGFEGLILRNPDVDYQYGRRRVGYMEKFKAKTDGKFVIVDIQPERKRNLPIITCRNDINDSTFETRFSLPHDKQEYILNHKEDYIGKSVFISYGERSGVEKVPFHIKEVSLINAEV